MNTGCLESFEAKKNLISGLPPTQTLSLCEFDGKPLASGKSVVAYETSSVAVGLTCNQELRTCDNGKLSGTYTYSACQATPPIQKIYSSIFYPDATPRTEDLAWSSAGPVAGMNCLLINEASDPHTWNDNYLCTKRDFGFVWSASGPITGKYCLKMDEPADPNTWADNYLCMPSHLGLRWSASGPISGMDCLQFNEPADPNGWDNNYLCTLKPDTQVNPHFVSSVTAPSKLIDSSDNDHNYAYGPSIVRVGSTWHMYYCSIGSPWGWDAIRHAISSDGVNWSTPEIILRVSEWEDERAACDPSLVRYKGFYYLFYSGNKYDVQTVNFIARSDSPNGPFAKLTKRGTWEVNAVDPQIILSPLHPSPNSQGWYGLGQPTVIVKDEKLYQWFTDTTEQSPTVQVARIYLSISNDPASWPTRIPTNVYSGSVDVKYDREFDQFVMFAIGNEHELGTYITMRTSKDGITWSEPTTVMGADKAPPWINNIGVAGLSNGDLIRDQLLMGFGAPYDLNPNYNNNCGISPVPYCWGNWDLYVSQLNLQPTIKNLHPTSIVDKLNWSYYNPVSGSAACTLVNEPASPNSWGDNYLCSNTDYGLRWSHAQPIAGMYCTTVNSPEAPVSQGWTDNYICSPTYYGLFYSTSGKVLGKTCILINEPAEPLTSSWNDNYLCW